jgi:predicted trehalose synthase
VTISASELRAMRSSVPARFASVAALGALFSVLLFAPAFGQEAVEPEETAVVAEPDTNVESASDEAVAPAVAEAGTVLDYEPTESISEDLSVSFPVDI